MSHPSASVIEFFHTPTLFLVRESFRHGAGYLKLHRLASSPNIPEDVNLRLNGESPFVVFVLGESATRNRWSLYGYSIKTTPCMDAMKDELCVFSDCVTSAPATEGAMKFLLTNATQKKPFDMKCTLPQILRAAGYKCYLYSCQSRWSQFSGYESYLFSGCERMTFLSEENPHGPLYDDALLPYLDAICRERVGKPTVVFLHVNGSHLPPQNFYPQSFRLPEFRSLNSLTDSEHYDNSIAYTDRFLGAVVERLRAISSPTLMFYISDHGESAGADHWRVWSNINVWEIPMICWFSNSFRAAYPRTVEEMKLACDRPLQTEFLLPGLLTLFQVYGYAAEADDFHNAKFKERPRIIQNSKVYSGRSANE